MGTKLGSYADNDPGLGSKQKPAPQSSPGTNPTEGKSYGIDKDSMGALGSPQKPGRP